MAWKLVAEGTPDTFQHTGAIDYLPHGTRIRLEMDTIPGLAYLADIWGAEWVVEKFIIKGVTVTNTYSDGNDLVIVDGYVNSPSVATIITIVLVVLSIGGIAYIVREMRLWASLPGEGPISNLATIAKWGTIGVLGILGVMIIKEVRQ